MEKKRKRDKAEHDKIIEEIYVDVGQSKKNREERKQETKKVKRMSKKLSTALSEENIKEILHDNLEYFRNIESGSEES